MKKHSAHGRNAVALRAGIMFFCSALSAAYAAKPGTASVFDLDITRFSATPAVDLSSRDGADILIELSVRNKSRVEATGRALLVGRTIPGDSLVFNRWLGEVSDHPGGGATLHSYTIHPSEIDMRPSFGGIRWTVYVEDQDPDFDTATDITVVSR